MEKTDNQNQMLQCMNRLISYAVERQLEFEVRKKEGKHLWSNPDIRNARTRGIIRGICNLYSISKQEEDDLIKSFDSELCATKDCIDGVKTIPQTAQRQLIQWLLQYAYALVAQPTDTRKQLLQISDHFEDITAYLGWDASKIGLYPARDWMNHTLARMTALQNILFTRILIGSERMPADSDFVSGAVREVADVADTDLFYDLCEQNPEYQSWPAICTVYCGGGRHNLRKLSNAKDLDLEIMRRYGDKFLNLEGIDVCVFPFELEILKK